MRISIEEAANLLKSGHVVGVPTETVYGLAASIDQKQAIEIIFRLKKRPLNNPLIIHLSERKALKNYVDVTEDIEELTQMFWPGPLTLVLPVLLNKTPSLARAGLSTAAFRVPSHPIARAVLMKAGPLVMPSANLSGKPSSTSAGHVEHDFGTHFPVIDGGDCDQGVESTILVKTQDKWIIARLGALPPECFLKQLGYLPDVMILKDKISPLAPGQLFRHYAPNAKLYCAEKGTFSLAEAIIGFADRAYQDRLNKPFFSLGLSTNPEMALHALYAILRQIDEQSLSSAWVDMDFPATGLWLTLRERLLRACQADP